jgi:hypothetical protein
MAEFRVDRRARKRHRCDGRSYDDCARWIEPGEMYQISTLVPGGELGNEHWWHMKMCAPCTAYYRHPISEAVATDAS